MIRQGKGIIIQNTEVLQYFHTFLGIVDEEMVEGAGRTVGPLSAALRRIPAWIAAMVTVIVVTEYLRHLVARYVTTFRQLPYGNGPLLAVHVSHKEYRTSVFGLEGI